MDANKNTKKQPGWNKTDQATMPVTPEQKFARADLKPDDFDRLLKQKGVRVKVYLTGFCSNVKSIDGGEHEIDCPYCNGSGFLDVRPIETMAFIANQGMEMVQSQAGNVWGNTISITFQSGIELQYFSLVELLDFNEIYYQRVARSPLKTDTLQYRAKRVNFLEMKGKFYSEGPDFVLDVNGHIKWNDGKGPLEGEIYSVHYEASVQFRTTTAMHSNRFTQVLGPKGITFIKLPEQWACTKEFLVRRRGVNGSDVLQNPIPNYNNITPEE